MSAASAEQIVKDAFQRFEAMLKTSDIRSFRSTSLEDVYKAAEIIERDQEQRKCMRNLRKIDPFLQALRKIGVAIDVLCQGTPYLPYIWV